MFSLGAFAVIFDPQGRVLLCHRRDMDMWNLPGGGVESGELPDEAVVIANSINYMLSEADLRSAFQTAYVHLKLGGVFCTYAGVTRQNFRQNDTRVSTHSGGSVIVTFIENRYDPNPQDSTYENAFVYLIRRKLGEGQLEIETDRHLGGLFDLETWKGCLSETGFEVYQTELGEGVPFFVCRR